MKKLLLFISAGLILATLSGCVKEDDKMPFTATKRTTSAFYKRYPASFVAGSRVYYVWLQQDNGNYRELWTAVMNTDGTNFVATLRRSIATSFFWNPRLFVSGTKIYYVWTERDVAVNMQIWTGVMNTDGSGWSATQRTDTLVKSKDQPYLQIVGNKIYYVWREKTLAGEVSIWTASMNTDGSGWSVAKRQIVIHDSLLFIVRQHVVDSKIYYVWRDQVGADYQIWTASMNTDGSGWTATKRWTSEDEIRWVTLYVYGNTIHYAWWERDAPNLAQIWTATMRTNGTNWVAMKRTDSAEWGLLDIELIVYHDTIYYACTRFKLLPVYQTHIFTAEMKTNGTGWQMTQRTTSNGTFLRELVQQGIGTDIHYVWSEYDGSDLQIWTGRLPLPEAQPIIALIG